MITNQDKYLDLFVSEAHDHLDLLEEELIKLEKTPKDKNILKELMRHAHTLKGAAATVGFGDISNLAHSFEGMVENIKNNIAAGGTEILFGAVDELRSLVDKAEAGAQQQEANPLVDEVGELEQDDLKDASQMVQNPETFRKITEVKVRTEKLDSIMDIAAELLINKLNLERVDELSLDSLQHALDKNSRLINDLQYSVLQLRLTPIDQIFHRFPRMVRDMSKKQKKDIEFIVNGGEIELDRGVLDDLGEPLVHLLRNSVDHGIKKKGTIKLTAKRERNSVVVRVEDDGEGVNWEKLAEKSNTDMSKLVDKSELLFKGVSTAEKITETSGRGVGLYAVREKVEALGGTIDVISNPGEGTVFVLTLPVSLAIINALILRVDKNLYALSINDVERLLNIRDIPTSTQANQLIAVVNKQEVPLVNLMALLDVGGRSPDAASPETIVLSKVGEKMFGFLVNEIVSQQDIIVKTLSSGIRKKVDFTAVTILGDGSPVPILDTEALIKLNE